jgi:hypothetical protein
LYPVIVVALTLGMLSALLAAAGWLYRGPATLPRVLAVMPGVPIFPSASVAPENALAQRLLAAPLLLARRQGARRAEAVLLRAPGDHEFVVDWYRRMAPSQHWTQVGQARVDAGTRLVFTRVNEGLQVTVGPSNGLFATVQYLYFDGMSAGQAQQLLAAAPKPPARVEPRPRVAYPKFYIAKDHIPASPAPVAAPPLPKITSPAAPKVVIPPRLRSVRPSVPRAVRPPAPVRDTPRARPAPRVAPPDPVPAPTPAPEPAYQKPWSGKGPVAPAGQ